VTTGDEELEAWGLVGGGLELALSGVEGAGFFWVQDTAPGETRAGVAITVEGVPPGSYTVRPFDTWQGVYLDASRATAGESGQLLVVLPPFSGDIAVRLER